MSVKSKVVATIASAALAATALFGCGGSGAEGEQPAGDAAQAAADEKIEVVCATFPAYDWVREVVGDEADRYDISYLMEAGVDLHSYQPSVEDMAKIADADLFVYVGGESDEWAGDAVETSQNPNLHTVNMLEEMGDAVFEEEVVEGMEAEEEEEEEGEEEGPEYDEHVWLSLRNAQSLVDAIAQGLSDIDPDAADTYAANAEAYKAQLADLDARYTAVVEAATNDTIVFADRFPFRYLVEDYGINYYAAFVGCSAETEASFQTVAFLADKLDELGLSKVLIIENSDGKIAKTVIENTADKDQEVLVMDSLQSVPSADVAAGKTYLGTMEDNLSVLEAALA